MEETRFGLSHRPRSEEQSIAEWVARWCKRGQMWDGGMRSVVRYFTVLLFFGGCVIGCFAFRALKPNRLNESSIFSSVWYHIRKYGGIRNYWLKR